MKKEYKEISKGWKEVFIETQNEGLTKKDNGAQGRER